ncbi:endonuclease/exonuclease/phosphatase family [Auricularia subglabra TFB-10046 SS5]|uniref:Endonuclease/exonuclease/phosphatase family n=1 Tax=Auricularia subglabra (strain TFB-10046 / SS5) TaxID=717982 RepID=J0WQJ2_AURST|nr:endonuclease/exonuclease/phosphatase family [Auricularia subglabra TFB-10046 SS5]
MFSPPFLLATFVAILSFLATPSLAVAVARASGSLKLVSGKTFTFRYSTKDKNEKNWIGLYYSSGGGPVNQKQNQDSLVWKYAPYHNGTLELDPKGLSVGTYKAFFLAKDGYQWLADPITVTNAGPAGAVSWLVDSVRLQNARQGSSYRASVRGLVKGGSSVTFSISNGDWAKINNDGVITGTPGSSAKDTTFTVTAKGSDGKTDTVKVTVPVRKSGAKLVENLQVMTYNLWHGGTKVKNYHEKQVRFIATSGADLVGMQETTGGHALRLANALGWYPVQGSSAGIISRYPIEAWSNKLGHGQWARVALDGSKQLLTLFNVHLGYNPYGPYDFCFDKLSVAQTLKNEEKSKRTPQIKATVDAMKTDIARAASVPLLLTGDFNAPSHLDYTPALKSKNCGYDNVPWPTSVYPTNATLTDSFRVAHPDPVKTQGTTWSPIYLKNNNRPEPMDRIDFIYFKGSLSVVDSKTLLVGKPKPEPDHANNEWTSDHRAVMTTFKLK